MENPYEFYFPIENTDNKDRLLYLLVMHPKIDRDTLPSSLKDKFLNFLDELNDIDLMHFVDLDIGDKSIKLSTRKGKLESRNIRNSPYKVEIIFYEHAIILSDNKHKFIFSYEMQYVNDIKNFNSLVNKDNISKILSTNGK